MAALIDINDGRTVRALEVLATASQWARITTQSGEKYYGVPSQQDATRLYLTNSFTCDCPSFRFERDFCKHVLACRLYCAIVRAQRSANVSHRPGLKGQAA